MKTNRNSKLIIFVCLSLVIMLLSSLAIFTQAKYTVQVSMDNFASVSVSDYGFKYSVDGDNCYITSFYAQFDSQDNLMEYNPSDSKLGSLLLDNSNSWVLTFPSTYTQSGKIYTNIIVRDQSASTYGFPICDESGTPVLKTNKNQLINKIVIPNGITGLSSKAFYKYSNLTDVTLGNSVEYVDELSFSLCTSLVNVNLSSNLQRIGADAFTSCTSIVNLIIPENVTYIDSNAFKKCTSLRSIYIPSSVTTIVANKATKSPFYNENSSAKIYCGASTAQSGWDSYWNYYSKSKKLSVYYNYSLNYYLWVTGQ